MNENKKTEHHFKVEEAIKYGIYKAILLYNIRFWLEKNLAGEKHIYESKEDKNTYVWTYNTGKAFAKLFPYMKENSINVWLLELKEAGVLLTDNFNKTKYDRTNWYTIKDEYLVSNQKSIMIESPSIMTESEWSMTESESKMTQSRPIPDNNTINNTNKNKIPDFSTKNSEGNEKSSISEKNEISNSSENSKAEALPKKRNFKNPDDEIISEIIDAFKPINSLYANCYKRKVEKDAILDLVKVSSKEELLDIIINKLPVINGEKYAPRITKPSELANKWATLQTFLKNNPNLFSDKPFEKSQAITEDSSYDEETGTHYKNGSLQFSDLTEDQQVKYLVDMARRLEHKDDPIVQIDEMAFERDFKKSSNKPLEKKDIRFINF